MIVKNFIDGTFVRFFFLVLFEGGYINRIGGREGDISGEICFLGYIWGV